MKASKLIEELQKLIAQHGDLDIYIDGEMLGDLLTIKSVTKDQTWFVISDLDGLEPELYR
jgi:hypothetical protein